MSYRKLDEKGKPIPKGKRTKRIPVKRLIRGIDHFHYEIVVTTPQENGKHKYTRRRLWLPNDEAADAVQRELRNQEPAGRITWREAHDKWRGDKLGKRSPLHLAAVERTMARWTADFGASSTIEGTSLATFSRWIASQSKNTKGRGAQLHHSHLMTIAKWCRSNGLIASIPFEHAPFPEAKLAKRKAATIEDFIDISDELPEHMVWMWFMMGLTGMRISAACSLLENDIDASSFTVTTKGNKRDEYEITPELRVVIDKAREWKHLNGHSIGTLFCTDRGRVWRRDTYSAILRSKFPDYKISPHQLRHMVGTIMGESGLSVDMIKAGLRHESRNSSEGYTHQTRKMKTVALGAVSDALKNVKKMSKTDTFLDTVLSSTVRNCHQVSLSVINFECHECGCKHSIELDLILKAIGYEVVKIKE